MGEGGGCPPPAFQACLFDARSFGGFGGWGGGGCGLVEGSGGWVVRGGGEVCQVSTSRWWGARRKVSEWAKAQQSLEGGSRRWLSTSYDEVSHRKVPGKFLPDHAPDEVLPAPAGLVSDAVTSWEERLAARKCSPSSRL